MDIRAHLTDALGEAINDPAAGVGFTGGLEWGQYLADVLLSLPGIAIVELPEPIQSKPGWTDFGFAQVDDRAPGQVAYFTSMAWAGTWTSTAEAQRIAAALLAAANKAEQYE